jgi:hypothetical protein
MILSQKQNFPFLIDHYLLRKIEMRWQFWMFPFSFDFYFSIFNLLGFQVSMTMDHLQVYTVDLARVIDLGVLFFHNLQSS